MGICNKCNEGQATRKGLCNKCYMRAYRRSGAVLPVNFSNEHLAEVVRWNLETIEEWMREAGWTPPQG